MVRPMGESKRGGECLRVDFDRRLKWEFYGSKITADAGLLAYRELDDAIELTEMADDVLADSRTGKNGRHSVPPAANRNQTLCQPAGHRRERPR